MKKYLMTGIAAVAMGAAFTSCSHDIEGMTQAQIDQQNYETAFKNYVGGNVASNQDWGFGNGSTRSVWANGNEWSAEKGGSWLVPDVLTDDQIYIVKEYFQNVPNPEYKDPKWINYFMQQVYKGGTKPGSHSTESYKAADGTTDIVGSDHMDHLAAIDGDIVDHINNFNHGDAGEYANVLDNGGDVNNGPWHKDKINLMTNSTTKSFGYYNSNSSVRRTEYTGLVSWETIAKWATDNGYDAKYAKALNDGWNRSFMGFDFEMMIGGDLYQKQSGEIRYVTIDDIPGNTPQYIWDGEKVIKWFDQAAWDQPRVFAEGYDEFIKINNAKIPYLVTNTNMYAGSRLDAQSVLTNITQTNLKVYKDYSDDVKNVECLNLPLIKAAFEAGYYPTKDQAQDWVKVGGTADGYYSDWIVTLTEAKHSGEQTEEKFDLRIIAEDLNANADDNDWDFNDVVIDVKFGSPAKVVLRAAGGTMKLRINEDDALEVHELFGVATNVMVNTKWTGSNTDEKPAVDLTDKLNVNIADATAAKNLKLEVFKNGEWQELKAKTGEPACKIAVKPTFQWLDERQSIKDVHPQFVEWVTTDPTIIWY